VLGHLPDIAFFLSFLSRTTRESHLVAASITRPMTSHLSISLPCTATGFTYHNLVISLRNVTIFSTFSGVTHFFSYILRVILAFLVCLRNVRRSYLLTISTSSTSCPCYEKKSQAYIGICWRKDHECRKGYVCWVFLLSEHCKHRCEVLGSMNLICLEDLTLMNCVWLFTQ
jgi:hypothetical protein